MLVLSRKLHEVVVIDGGRITVEVVGMHGDKVKLGIIAPADVAIDRLEIHRAKGREAPPEEEGGFREIDAT